MPYFLPDKGEVHDAHKARHYAHPLALVLIALPMLSGCKTAQNVIAEGAEAAAPIILPPSEEAKLGKEMSAEIEKELKIHPNPEVQGYIQRLGAQVAGPAQSRLEEGITLTFKVVDDPDTVNAFAIPGGYIYVYSGLLLKADNEAEVIGVLGHEAGARHRAPRRREARRCLWSPDARVDRAREQPRPARPDRHWPRSNRGTSSSMDVTRSVSPTRSDSDTSSNLVTIPKGWSPFSKSSTPKEVLVLLHSSRATPTLQNAQSVSRS